MKTINCADCNVVYEYEPAKGYPDKRKYCANCSEKKKQSWEGRPENPEPTKAEPAGAEVVDMTGTVSSGDQSLFNLSDGNIRIGALNAAIATGSSENDPNFWNKVKEFEEYIRNGK